MGQAEQLEQAAWLRLRPILAENFRSGWEIRAKSSKPLWQTMEKRLPIAMVVNLAPAHVLGASCAELTYTNNVSAHGACVVSNRQWQSGEIVNVASFPDEIAMRGKVVYCHRHGSDQYAIGLNFQNDAAVWSTYLKYAGRPQETAVLRQALVRQIEKQRSPAGDIGAGSTLLELSPSD